MRRASGKCTRSAKLWVFILEVAAIAPCQTSRLLVPGRASQDLVQGQVRFLAVKQAISFAIDTTLEVVTDQDQKLGFAIQAH